MDGFKITFAHFLKHVVAGAPREGHDREGGILVGVATKGPPSVTKRFFTSQVWHHWLVTDFLASAPMIVPPTSWMIFPPGSMRVPPSSDLRLALLPPIASIIAESLLHVLGLARLVIRPFPMEAQHGNTPFVLHVGIDFAI